MTEDELVSNILHDLAGMMTSVQGLAQILETKSDHPSRDEFAAMLSDEATKAAHAVKDLQLLRALNDGSPVEDLQRVTVSELFLTIREGLSEDLRHGFRPPPPDLPDITVDKDLLADLIGRCYETASQTNPAEDHHVGVVAGDGRIEITLDLGPPDPDAELIQGVRSGRKGMRPAAIAARLLPRWNGSVDARLSDDGMTLVFLLPVSE